MLQIPSCARGRGGRQGRPWLQFASIRNCRRQMGSPQGWRGPWNTDPDLLDGSGFQDMATGREGRRRSQPASPHSQDRSTSPRPLYASSGDGAEPVTGAHMSGLESSFIMRHCGKFMPLQGQNCLSLPDCRVISASQNRHLIRLVIDLNRIIFSTVVHA